jgi:hypothetical protein
MYLFSHRLVGWSFGLRVPLPCCCNLFQVCHYLGGCNLRYESSLVVTSCNFNLPLNEIRAKTLSRKKKPRNGSAWVAKVTAGGSSVQITKHSTKFVRNYWRKLNSQKQCKIRFRKICLLINQYNMQSWITGLLAWHGRATKCQLSVWGFYSIQAWEIVVLHMQA